MKALPDKRTLATAAALACLLPVSWQARGECVPSIVVQRVNDEKFDVTAVEGTSTGECMETEVHKDGDEVRSHTTTLPPDGNANSPGQDTTMILNKEVWRLDKKGGGQKDHYGQFGGEWPATNIRAVCRSRACLLRSRASMQEISPSPPYSRERRAMAFETSPE